MYKKIISIICVFSILAILLGACVTQPPDETTTAAPTASATAAESSVTTTAKVSETTAAASDATSAQASNTTTAATVASTDPDTSDNTDQTHAADGPITVTKNWKIALITMDSADPHWVALNESAQGAANDFKVTVDFLSPDVKDDALQIECVNKAVTGGYDAIAIAANSPDAISPALKAAITAGLKIIYVDSPANVSAEATIATDNAAAGKTAGEQLLSALVAGGTITGKIGIIGAGVKVDSCVKRDGGFRSAFEGTRFEFLETQYGDGDAAKSQNIAEDYIAQGVVGIFGCDEGSAAGTGNAIKASDGGVIGIGFGVSDEIRELIADGYLLATMEQNPDIMGYECVKAAVRALEGENLGGAVTDTGASIIRQ